MTVRAETKERMEEAGERADEPPLALAVEVVHEAGDWAACEPIAEAAAAVAGEIAARVELGAAACSACLALTSDAEVALLNGRFRGKPVPTNVLSFPASPAPHSVDRRAFLGDIVLARDTVFAEAAAAGIPPRHHLIHLVAHGLLHLLGFDHEQSGDAAEMEALEVEILAALAIPDPYAESEPDAEARP